MSDDQSAGEGADPVELANGYEVYKPGPDIAAFNTLGMSAPFERSWRSDESVGGVHSYGLGAGWKHNYDHWINVESASSLSYHTTGNDIVRFGTVFANGTPTGQFLTLPGSPYILTGQLNGSGTSYVYFDLANRDGSKIHFEPNVGLPASKYRPTRIYNRQGHYLNINWIGDQLTSVSNAAGTTLLTLNYTSEVLTSVVDNNGRSVRYLHGTAGTQARTVLTAVSQICASTDSNPQAKVNYSYSDIGDNPDFLEPLITGIAVPSPSGSGVATTSIFYNNNTQEVSRYIDARGNIQDFTYGTNNTVVRKKTPGGQEVFSYTHLYNDLGLPSGRTDGLGNSTSIQYSDPSNQFLPTSVADEDGRITSYTYNAYGNITSITSPRGVVTTYTYDYSAEPWGWLTSSQEGNLEPIGFAYSGDGLLESVTKPKPGSTTGTVTYTFAHDTYGNITSITSPGNNAGTTKTTSFLYTSDGTYSQPMVVGEPIRIVDGNGLACHIRYDNLGRIISKWDANGNQVNNEYNLANQVTKITYPATGQTGPGNSAQTNAYLFVGGVKTSSSLLNESGTAIRQATYQYDALGNLTGMGGLSDPVAYTYDAANRLKTISDGNNGVTTYSYDAASRVTSTLLPGGDTIQFTSYTPAGRLLQTIDAGGVVKNFTYNDPEGQLTAVAYPSSSSLNVSYAYDGYGRPTQTTDGSGTYSYTYGRAGELSTATTTYTGLPARTLTVGYYPDGSRSGLSTPFGSFTYNYDAGSRLTSMTNPNSETSSWSYYDNGWAQRQTYANGFKADLGYNALGQLTSMVNQTSANVIRSAFSAFAYDGAGNQLSVTAVNNTLSSYGGTITNQFNSKDELTAQASTLNGGYSHSFSYDPSGNPTVLRGASKTYNTKNQLTGTGFVYNANGTPTTYGGSAYTFDAEQRLNANRTYTAGYRQDNMRAWKQVGSARTHFLYDGDRPIFEMTSTGALSATNTFGAMGLLSRRTGTTTTYYAFDPKGNTYQRINASQAVVSSHRCDAYGNVTSNVSTTTDPWRGRGAQRGYYWEDSIGHYVTNQRYYDPTNARFLTRDPISYQGGPNLYRYVSGNPISQNDPSGLEESPADFGRDIVRGLQESKSRFFEANADKGIVGVISSTIIGTAADYASGAVMSLLGQGEALGRWAGGCGSLSEAVMDGAGIALNVAGGFSIASAVRAGTECALARAIYEGAACFPAGTLVELADGSSKPIEQIKKGDRVMTRPQWADGQAKAEAGVVIQTLKRESTELIFVKFASGETLEATGNHPFYVQDFGFVEAERLQVGSRVSTATGDSQRVEAIIRLRISAPVYNFTVARTHTYFVGRPNSWLWVHNAGCGPAKWGHRHHIFAQGEAKKIIEAQPGFTHPAFSETVDISAEFHREFVHHGGWGGGHYNKHIAASIEEHGGYNGITHKGVTAIQNQLYKDLGFRNLK